MRTATAFATLLALIAAAGCANYRELSLADGTVILGSTGGLPIPAEFFSVRVGHRWSGASLRTSAHLHLRGRELVLRTLSPADLRRVGIDVQASQASDGLQVAFVGYGDQNRVGGLEFYFSEGRLREFYARCHEATRCDYQLSWPGHRRFALPIAQRDLASVIDPVVSKRDYAGH